MVSYPSRHASSTDASTWATFDEALTALKNPKNKFVGLDFAVGNGIVGVDLDGAVVEGKIADWAYRFLEPLKKGYIETSPSGTGLRAFFLGSVPKAIKTKQVEIYPAAHFLSVTGNSVNGHKKLARLSNDEATAITESLRTSKPSAEQVGADSKLAKLLKGEWAGLFPSQSEADLSFLSLLARRGFSPSEAEAAWRSSGLNREKLEREDYVRGQLNKAYEGISNAAYTGDGSDWAEAFPALSEFDGEEFPEKPIVKGLIEEGCVHLFAGAMANYKSCATLEILSAMLEGRKAFDHFPIVTPVDGAIYYVPEMSQANFTRFARNFRLDKAGEKFRHRTAKQGAVLPLDDPRLQQAVQGKVLVLDTLLYVAAVEDAYKATDWLPFSNNCRQLIEQYGCKAIILLHHPTKSGAESTEIEITKMISQSIALAGLIDVAFAFKRTREDGPDVYVKCLKDRPWEKRPDPFIITARAENGDSFISQGRFPIKSKPGKTGAYSDYAAKPGRKADPKKAEWVPKAAAMKEAGKSLTQISEALNKDGYSTTKSGVQKALQATFVKGQTQ